MNYKKIKSLLPVITILLVLIYLSSRDNPSDTLARRQLQMGTIVEITLFNEDNQKNYENHLNAAFNEIKRLENLLGRQQRGSDVWNLNNSSGKAIKVSPETIHVVEKGIYYNKITKGAFDITLGRLVSLWNFEGETKAPPTDDNIKKALLNRDMENITIDESKSSISKSGNMHLDLGGIAKGYIIDMAAQKLKKEGINNFIINAGGDMLISGRKGEKPWRVGIQHPRDEKKVIAHIDVTEQETAIVTSGDYERFFNYSGQRYHHILDPSTGYPTKDLISATITAPDAEKADAISTAVLVMGKTEGMALINSIDNVEGMLIDGEENTHISRGLEGKVIFR